MNSIKLQDLQTFVEKEIITTIIAEKIERYYQSQKPEKKNRLFTIFGIFGSL